MDNFDEFKQLWRQVPSAPAPIDSQQLVRNTAPQQRKLERTQLFGAVTLFVTAVLLLIIGFGIGLQFRSTLTYVAIVLLAVICVGQGLINLSVYGQLRRIDVTATVTNHLHQWESYYLFRKRLIRINGPVYFLLLNGALGMYFIEILGLMPLTSRIIVLALYIIWMLFSYFVLGKRTIRKEDDRLNEIIDNLRQQQQQLIN
jgi:amino acid permease